MSKKTSSKIFKKLVNSPVGIIAEFIVNKLASENGCEPLRNYFLEIQTGKTPPMSNPEYYASNDIEWIKPSDIGGNMILSAKDFISKKAVEDKKATIYKPNTVLFNCIGNLGRLGLVKQIASSNQQITGVLFNDQVHPEFVYYHFLTKEDEFYKLSSQTTLPIINQKGLGNLDFTCPNVSVQKEVVRFLEYCKECLDDSSYPTNSDFELSNVILDFSNKAFKAFYTQRSLLAEFENQLTQLGNLNQGILQEAVQGKLVKQDPKDEPASKLLERIKEEKAKSGKKEKHLPPIKPEEIPFEIPENWVWCRFNEIYDIRDGTHDSPKYHKEGYPFITSKNLVNGELNFSDIKYISLEDHIEFSKRSKVEVDDILFAMIGTIGNPVIIKRIEKEFSIKNVALFKNFAKELIYTKFIFWLLIFFTNELKSQSRGGIQKFVSLQILRSLTIPLPPLSEQKRIVAEIEKQLAKTKQLKEHIIANQQATEQLLKALLHQAFEVGE
ncbi:hypothetical protein CBW16_10080 [Flavobacteriaceae bacterium JJC]|nr:hypothetical protein CBW16_10080 [Flavobacteriaceae bacterium JJC]